MTTPDEAQALLPVMPDRDIAQFFFEMGFGACYAEAIVQNGNTVPFTLTDAEIERQWAISREAYDDADELEAMLSLARRISHSLPGAAPVTLIEGFEAEQDGDTFTVRFPDGHAITARASGQLIVTNAVDGFAPFETTIAALTPSALSPVCAALSSSAGANDPQDCDWPVCGCDPHADKVIAALQESGLMVSSSAETYTANMKAAGEKIGRDLTDQARAASKLRRGLPIPSALSGDAGEGRLREALETLIRKTRIQATCLEHYAEQSGFTAKPIPSAFHSQAAHFRTFADEAAAALPSHQGAE